MVLSDDHVNYLTEANNYPIVGTANYFYYYAAFFEKPMLTVIFTYDIIQYIRIAMGFASGLLIVE